MKKIEKKKEKTRTSQSAKNGKTINNEKYEIFEYFQGFGLHTRNPRRFAGFVVFDGNIDDFHIVFRKNTHYLPTKIGEHVLIFPLE